MSGPGKLESPRSQDNPAPLPSSPQSTSKARVFTTRSAKKHQKVANTNNRKTQELVCNFCDRLFISKIKLKHHIKINHRTKLSASQTLTLKPRVKTLKIDNYCLICKGKRKFTDMSRFHCHLTMHGKLAMFRCSVCLFKSNGTHGMLRHIRERHTARDSPTMQLILAQHLCQECARSFEFKQELTRHTKQAHALQMHCSQCEATFTTIPHLKEHVTLKHGTWENHLNTICEEVYEKSRYIKPDPLTGELKCFLCTEKVTKTKQLRVHIGECHLESEIFFTPTMLDMEFDQYYVPRLSNSSETPPKIVPNTTKNEKKMSKAPRIRSKKIREKQGDLKLKIRKSEVCYMCKAEFASLAQLRKHVNRSECASPPYFCTACQEWFAHWYSHESHWYRHHGNTKPCFSRLPSALFHATFQAPFLSSFPCKFCNLYLESETDRQFHLAESHQDIFICLTCSFASEKIDSVQDHISVVHPDSKPKPKIMHKKTFPKCNPNEPTESPKNMESPPKNLSLGEQGDDEIKMEVEESLNFEYVECSSILQNAEIKNAPMKDTEYKNSKVLSDFKNLDSTAPTLTPINIEPCDPLGSKPCTNLVSPARKNKHKQTIGVELRRQNSDFSSANPQSAGTKSSNIRFRREESSSDFALPMQETTGTQSMDLNLVKTESHTDNLIPDISQTELLQSTQFSQEKSNDLTGTRSCQNKMCTESTNFYSHSLGSLTLTNSMGGRIKEESEEITIKEELLPA